MEKSYVVYVKQGKSEEWIALSIKKSKEEGEREARDLMRKLPFVREYKIEEADGLPHENIVPSDSAQVREITPKELKRRLEAGDPSLQLLDVREDWEYERESIPGALHMKLKDVPRQMLNLPRDQEYVLYCAVGYRSYQACEFLQENGFRVQNLKGGIFGWKGIGFVVPILETAMSITGKLRK